jgi:simple sugar transport system substrate-binding protein
MESTNFSEYFSRLLIKRRRLLQTAMVGPAGAAFLAACSSGSSTTSTTQNTTTGGGGNFPSHRKWNFVFVNHVTTNPFFVPTIYGIQDACALVNCS